MLSPSYLESLPVGIVNQYAELESWIIADISRRIAGADFVMTPTAEWQIKKAQMLRLSYDDVVKQVSQTLGKSQKEVRALFKDAGVTALKSDASIYSLAGKDPAAFMNSLALNRTLMAGIQQTNGLMSNFCRSLASESNKLYNDLLDQAYFEVQSGAFSYQTSIRKAVKQLGQQGIQTVKYPSGHTDQVDVAVRRALISGVNITCARLQLDLASEMDCDLVEVTSHFGARPSHADWQGGIYSISGRARGYSGLAEATGYGSGDGLCGWNCRHNFYPFFEGISKPLGNPHDAKESEEYYNATQKQRTYERKIRKSKRQVEANRAAMEATTDKDLKALLEQDKRAAQARLADIQSQLDKFCKENDLYRRRERESIAKKGIRIPNKTKGVSNTKSQVVTYNARSIQEAQQWAINHLGMKNVSYKDIGIDVANRINNSLSKTFDEYPILKGFIKQVKTDGRLNSVAQAEVSYSSGMLNTTLKLSKKDLDNLQKIDTMISRCVNNKWWTPKNGVDGVIDHELGHMIEYAITFRRHGIDLSCTDVNKIKSVFADLRARKVSAEIKDNVLLKLKITDTKVNIMDNLSEYGATNASEFLAEAISEIRNGNPRELAKEVQKLLKAVLI